MKTLGPDRALFTTHELESTSIDAVTAYRNSLLENIVQASHAYSRRVDTIVLDTPFEALIEVAPGQKPNWSRDVQETVIRLGEQAATAFEKTLYSAMEQKFPNARFDRSTIYPDDLRIVNEKNFFKFTAPARVVLAAEKKVDQAILSGDESEIQACFRFLEDIPVYGQEQIIDGLRHRLYHTVALLEDKKRSAHVTDDVIALSAQAFKAFKQGDKTPCIDLGVPDISGRSELKIDQAKATLLLGLQLDLDRAKQPMESLGEFKHRRERGDTLDAFVRVAYPGPRTLRNFQPADMSPQQRIILDQVKTTGSSLHRATGVLGAALHEPESLKRKATQVAASLGVGAVLAATPAAASNLPAEATYTGQTNVAAIITGDTSFGASTTLNSQNYSQMTTEKVSAIASGTANFAGSAAVNKHSLALSTNTIAALSTGSGLSSSPDAQKLAQALNDARRQQTLPNADEIRTAILGPDLQSTLLADNTSSLESPNMNKPSVPPLVSQKLLDSIETFSREQEIQIRLANNGDETVQAGSSRIRELQTNYMSILGAFAQNPTTINHLNNSQMILEGSNLDYRALLPNEYQKVVEELNTLTDSQWGETYTEQQRTIVAHLIATLNLTMKSPAELTQMLKDMQPKATAAEVPEPSEYLSNLTREETVKIFEYILGKTEGMERRQMEVALKFFNSGFDRHIAIGFAANARDETGSLDAGQEQKNGGTAIGWLQWDGVRKQQLINYANGKVIPWQNEDLQISFTHYEINGDEARAWSKIKETNNAPDAATSILIHFERARDSVAGGVNDGERRGYASDMETLFNATALELQPAPAPAPTPPPPAPAPTPAPAPPAETAPSGLPKDSMADGFEIRANLINQYGPETGHLPQEKLVQVGTDSKGRAEYLQADAAAAYNAMLQAYMNETGNPAWTLNDAYRDYQGQLAAKRKYGDGAAKPGTSEHGLGMAIDVDEKEAQDWIIINGWKYGWIWPKNVRDDKGPKERWHHEWKGKAATEAMSR